MLFARFVTHHTDFLFFSLIVSQLIMAAVLKKNLHELIECGICLDPMVDPRVLSCQHSFCTKCLIDLSSHNGTPEKFVVCPTCRSQTAMPKKGVYDLPPDFKANRLASLVNESECREASPNANHSESDLGEGFIEQEQVPKCAFCNKDKQAYRVKMFCKQCKDFMCSGCADNHKITSIFSTHELVEVTQNVCEWESEKCPEHPQKPQEYFCEDCKVLVCSACVTNEHRNHDVYYYVEHFKNRQKEIKRKQGALETVYSDSFISSANQMEMENYSFAVNQKIIEIEKDVQNSAERTIKEVEREKARLLSSLEKERMDFNKRFKDAQPYQLKSDVHILLQECEAYLKTRKPVELLTAFQHLSFNIDTTTKSIERNHKEVSSFLSSHVPTQFNNRAQRVVIGDIFSEKVGTSKSFPNAQLAKQFAKPGGAETPPELGVNSGDDLCFTPPPPSPPTSHVESDTHDWRWGRRRPLCRLGDDTGNKYDRGRREGRGRGRGQGFGRRWRREPADN